MSAKVSDDSFFLDEYQDFEFLASHSMAPFLGSLNFQALLNLLFNKRQKEKKKYQPFSFICIFFKSK